MFQNETSANKSISIPDREQVLNKTLTMVNGIITEELKIIRQMHNESVEHLSVLVNQHDKMLANISGDISVLQRLANDSNGMPNVNDTVQNLVQVYCKNTNDSDVEKMFENIVEVLENKTQSYINYIMEEILVNVSQVYNKTLHNLDLLAYQHDDIVTNLTETMKQVIMDNETMSEIDGRNSMNISFIEDIIKSKMDNITVVIRNLEDDLQLHMNSSCHCKVSTIRSFNIKTNCTFYGNLEVYNSQGPV